MNQAQHNTIVNFIWSIADDVLRDVYSGGKYRDIILPFKLLRHLDAILEPTKAIVIEIESETATIDTAIAKTLREIEMIKEYKEAMIAEAVMGKVNSNNTVNAQ